MKLIQLPLLTVTFVHMNESSKSSDNTNQQDLQTEDENINEVTPLLNNTVYTPMISNEKNVSRKGR